MSFQIREMILYSHNGKTSSIPFELGKVNVITGDSKSGKTALIDILNYCFGSDECYVPEGPIRRSVAWFGVVLQLAGNKQAFIARKCPEGKAKSSEECCVVISKTVSAPAFETLRQTTNMEGLCSLLASWSGIGEYTHEPDENHTRDPLVVTIRHATPYCFQPQYCLIQKNTLFFGAEDSFVAQSLKDTLPYLLGAVKDDYVEKCGRLRDIRNELRNAEKRLVEITALSGVGMAKAGALLSQARDVGLSSLEEVNNINGIISELKRILKTPLVSIADKIPQISEFNRLSEERESLLREQYRIRDEISFLNGFNADAESYRGEAGEQVSRLKTIEVFENAASLDTCPICSQRLANAGPLPGVDDVKSALGTVSSQLELATRNVPHIAKALTELQDKSNQVAHKISDNRSALEAVQKNHQDLTKARDEAAMRTLILGRIGMYVESLPEVADTSTLKKEIHILTEKRQALEGELGDEAIQERLESIAAFLGKKMTKWAQDLRLEHSSESLRFNFKQLTVVADTENGPVPMGKMGSGENWVGYHLISHLALHEWFTTQKRPVPRFLFLDQPSQIYFPAEKDTKNGSLSVIKDTDREALVRIFKMLFDTIASLNGKMQLIITEHADLTDSWYQDSVRVRWRGTKLIPSDWPVYVSPKE